MSKYDEICLEMTLTKWRYNPASIFCINAENWHITPTQIYTDLKIHKFKRRACQSHWYLSELTFTLYCKLSDAIMIMTLQ